MLPHFRVFSASDGVIEARHVLTLPSLAVGFGVLAVKKCDDGS